MLPIPAKNKIVVLAVICLALTTSHAFSSQRQGALKKSSGYKVIEVSIAWTVPLPKGWHEGLFSDVSDMWVSNGKNGKIWVVDTISGKVSSDILPVAGFTEQVLRKSGDIFFATDWDEKKIYTASLDKGKLKPETWISVSPAHPAGAVSIDGRLFVITWTRGMGTRFDLLELDGNLKPQKTISIQAIEEPAHLAWDGENLWITSWYAPLVYRVDTKNWEITGAFRSPVSKTTGIAWDGKYLWLTGTYSDLYKIEIKEACMNITVTSSAFKDGEMIPVKYTCDGDGMSPPLDWADIPSGAKSIAMISDDPDAPMGTWVHWVIFNIPPDITSLPEGVPPGQVLDNGAIQGMNDSRQVGYGSPCPPGGVHRYFFKVYALDSKISLRQGATKMDLEDAMKGHVLGQGQLMGRYKR
jgi:hypothetical protein